MSPSDRYSRQVRFTPLGEDGQRRLAASRAAIIGCGALGSFQAAALARAGAGHVLIIDRDYVELNNLQRQWLFDESDAAEALPKAIAAARKLRAINSDIEVIAEIADLTPANICDLLEDYQVLLDGTDNFETRYLINDYAVSKGVPWIYGAVVGSYGITMPVLPGRTCCLQCLYPEPPTGAQPTCETAGVVNTVPALIAAVQVSAALQILSGNPSAVAHRITTADVWTGVIRQIKQPQPLADCLACGRRIFSHLGGKHRAPISLCGRNAVQIHERTRPIDVAALAEQLRPLGTVRVNEFALRFFFDRFEMTVFPDGRAIINGTNDTGLARSLYARYIGL